VTLSDDDDDDQKGPNEAHPDEPLSEKDVSDLLYQFTDDLQDRTTEKRLKALQQCAATLARSFMPDAVDSFRVTLLTAAENSARRGGPTEKEAALTLLRLVVISLGTSATGVYPQFRPALLRLLQDPDEDLNVRVAAVQTLSLLSFICEESAAGEAIHEDLAALFQLFEADAVELASAAISGWSLLLTILRADTLLERYAEEALILLVELLEREVSVGVSAAAGRAIAYIYEVARAEEDYDETDLPVDVGEVVRTLEGLATERQRRVAKATQKDKRKVFRQIRDALRSGQAPEVVVVVNKQELRFDSFERLIQLDALRAALRSGFQCHLQYNELLHDIFDVRIQKETSVHKLSHIDKRLFCSKNSARAKDRTAARDSARAKKMAAGAAFH
jgi:hypothetical protein